MKWIYSIMILVCGSIAAGVAVKHDAMAGWLQRNNEPRVTPAEMEIAHRDAMALLTAPVEHIELSRSMFFNIDSTSQPIVIVGDPDEAERNWTLRMAELRANANSPVRSAGRMAGDHYAGTHQSHLIDDSIAVDSRITDRLNDEGKTIFQNSRFGKVSDYNKARRRQHNRRLRRTPVRR